MYALEAIRNEVGKLSETADSINEKIDAVVAAIGDEASQVAGEIQKLKDQIASGTPVTAGQLDAIGARLTGLKDSVSNIFTPEA